MKLRVFLDETLSDGYPSCDSDFNPICTVCGVSLEADLGQCARHRQEKFEPLSPRMLKAAQRYKELFREP